MRRLILTDYLPTGERNAVTGKQLAKIFNCSEREITIAVNALRKDGTFICSGTNGFWLPLDDKDIEGFVRQMRGRIADMEKVLKPAEDYLKGTKQ